MEHLTSSSWLETSFKSGIWDRDVSSGVNRLKGNYFMRENKIIWRDDKGKMAQNPTSGNRILNGRTEKNDPEKEKTRSVVSQKEEILLKEVVND